jgi:hypothetical protein
MGRENMDIADVRERRVIGDDPRETGLALRGVQAEAERPPEGALHHFERDAFRPV